MCLHLIVLILLYYILLLNGINNNNNDNKYVIYNNIKQFAYPNTPTATAASRIARSWSMSAKFSGRIVAVFLGWRSF